MTTMAHASAPVVDAWHSIAPTVLRFLGVSRQDTTHGWQETMRDITAAQALALFITATTELSDMQEYHQLILEIYLYTAFPSIPDVMRITEGQVSRLQDVSAHPIWGTYMDHPALQGFGATPASLLVLISSIPQEARNVSSTSVIYFEAHLARRTLDALAVGASAFLQAQCDRVMLFLHLVGAWIWQHEQIHLVTTVCRGVFLHGASSRIPSAWKQVLQPTSLFA